jgi:hypothetical protein
MRPKQARGWERVSGPQVWSPAKSPSKSACQVFWPAVAKIQPISRYTPHLGSHSLFLIGPRALLCLARKNAGLSQIESLILLPTAAGCSSCSRDLTESSPGGGRKCNAWRLHSKLSLPPAQPVGTVGSMGGGHDSSFKETGRNKTLGRDRTSHLEATPKQRASYA